MMVVTSPKLSLAVLIAIPLIVLPLVAYGRSVRALSREAQDTLAQASAYASESLAQVRVLQAFTHEKAAAGALRRGGRALLRRGKDAGQGARRTHRHRHLPRLRERRRRAVVRRAGRAVGRDDRGHGSASSCSMPCSRRRRSAGLSEVWGEVSQAAGAAERLSELLAGPVARSSRRAIRRRCPSRRAARSPSATSSFAYPLRPETKRARACELSR